MGRRSRQGIIGLLIGCACGVALAFPPAGKAATYRVIECARAEGAPAAPDANPFSTGASPVGGFQLSNRCDPSSGLDGLEVTGAASPSLSGERAGWRLSAPPATQFVGVSVFVRGRPHFNVNPEVLVVNTAAVPSVEHAFADEASIGSTGSVRAWNGEGGRMDLLEIRLICDVPPEIACAPSPQALINVANISMTLDETPAPTLTALGGRLVSNPKRSVRGIVDLVVDGEDAGSGLHSASLSVAGRTVASDGYACDLTPAGVARRLVPCPLSAQRTLAVDTRDQGFHTGLNKVQACLADFAGHPVCVDRDVRVDNVCPGTSGVAGLKRIRIRGSGAGKRESSRHKVVVRHGRKVKVRGRAVDGEGDPARRATICLGTHIAGNRYASETIDVTKTGKRGRFRFRLQPGPNRKLRIAAFPPGEPIEKNRRLLVRARPSLHIGGNRRPGAALHFKVRLNKPVAPGQRVEIRARSDAGWVGLPGCDGRSNERGRYRCGIEIPETAGGAMLRFRAVVLPTDDYPYLQGHSRTRTVRVRG